MGEIDRGGELGCAVEGLEGGGLGDRVGAAEGGLGAGGEGG